MGCAVLAYPIYFVPNVLHAVLSPSRLPIVRVVLCHVSIL